MLSQAIKDCLRILTFRQPSDAIRTEWRSYLAFGLFVTWLAGLGRYWDNPRAHLLQHLGLGSVVYVLALSLLIWILILPLKPKHWSYRGVLIFIAFCSPPALLYAIPVERFLELEIAQSVNAWFLAVVATWRVALLATFLSRAAKLSVASVVVGTLLPIALIVLLLSTLNLEHVVFSLMAGIAPEQQSPADISYGVVVLLSILSVMLAPFLLIAYVAIICYARRENT